jgi:hypothetical protein
MFRLIEKRCGSIELPSGRTTYVALQHRAKARWGPRHKKKRNVSMFVSMMNGLDRTLMIAAVVMAALPIAALVAGGAFA